jgi:hypothetical protein
MAYKISSYTKRQAEKLGVVVKPSATKGKKIDVFDKEGNKLASIGAIGYGDYPTFIATKGQDYADVRRKMYKIRHSGNRKKAGTPGYYADKLLW